MKYAFVFGSAAFIVPNRVISYADQESSKEFLRICSIYHDIAGTPDVSSLAVDLNIKDVNGSEIILINNQPVAAMNYSVETDRDNVFVKRTDGSLVIQVHQLSEEAAMDLEHNIVAELQVNAPVAVIRITGEFMVEGLHVRAENEKLLINDNGFATLALAGTNDLRFTVDGAVL